MKALFCGIHFVILLASCCEDSKKHSIPTLLGEIRKKLPNGWSVEYEAEYDLIEVTRAGDVEVYTMFPNQQPGQGSDFKEFSFALRLGEEVTKEDYRSADLQNRAVRTELGKLYDQMVALQISQKFDSFWPKNDGEKALVLRYENLKKKIKRLPDFAYRDISFSWIYGSPQNLFMYVADDEIRASCEAVRLDVMSVFSKYETRKSKDPDD